MTNFPAAEIKTILELAKVSAEKSEKYFDMWTEKFDCGEDDENIFQMAMQWHYHAKGLLDAYEQITNVNISAGSAYIEREIERVSNN